MRKYAIGFMCGLAFASASAIYASGAIQATLFPVSYEINGVKSELEQGYLTLNYNGRAYVPIRFAAESLDAVVIYDDASKTIKIDNGFSLGSIATEVRAGHLQVRNNGETSEVSGKLYAGQRYWDALYDSKMAVTPGSMVEIKGFISFYDDASNIIAKVPINVSVSAKGDQVKEFVSSTDIDVSGYAFATLEYVWPEPIFAFLPPVLAVTDSSGVVAVGQTDVERNGDYTKVRMQIAVQKEGFYHLEGVLTYYDKNNVVLGTAKIKSDLRGSSGEPGENLNIYIYETVGKGDFTEATKYTLEVNVLEPIDSTEAVSLQ